MKPALSIYVRLHRRLISAAAMEVIDRIEAMLDRLTDQQKTALAVGAGIGVAASLGYCAHRAIRSREPRSGPYSATTLPAGAYDAVIIGSGPSGSTCAFYMARDGARVALLDKEHFPRVSRVTHQTSDPIMCIERVCYESAFVTVPF